MAELATIQASERKNIGTGSARAIRRAAMVPCIVYGGGQEPVAIQMERKVIAKQLETAGFLSRSFEIEVDGKCLARVMPRAVQFHPVTDAPIHIDFVRVA